jgi:hypothetical protein
MNQLQSGAAVKNPANILFAGFLHFNMPAVFFTPALALKFNLPLTRIVFF